MHSPHIRQEYLQTSRVENYETKKRHSKQAEWNKCIRRKTYMNFIKKQGRFQLLKVELLD